MLAFLSCLKVKIERDKEIDHFNYNSKHSNKLIISDKILLEIINDCQPCQLCVLRSNSNVFIFLSPVQSE